MNTTSTAAAGAGAPGPTPARAQHAIVPAHSRQIAGQLSTLLQRDVEIVEQLNDAHHRLHDTNEQLYSALAPGARGITHDGAAAAISTSPTAPLPSDSRPSTTLNALQQIHRQIHRAFCAYQHAAEQRRQLAIDVGELSQQLTQALCAAGWSAEQARRANVHQLAYPFLDRPLDADRGDYAAERPA